MKRKIVIELVELKKEDLELINEKELKEFIEKEMKKVLLLEKF
jgi:hypothetical protein